jgi:hypothetical protein
MLLLVAKKERAFLSSWRETILIPILKPGKDPTVTTTYRPICLMSCVSRTLECMVNIRFINPRESKPISNAQQFFCYHHSTIDHLVLLEQKIQNGFILCQHFAFVFFDLEKAVI